MAVFPVVAAAVVAAAVAAPVKKGFVIGIEPEAILFFLSRASLIFARLYTS